VLEAGRGALVLVPEIALTPQLVARFRARLSAPVVALHSSLADGARLEAWRAAASGRAPVVIGTRSAVATSMPALGLVVVDEEHDASYKQQEGFRYSGRDLAIVRAQRAGVPVVLGSATPSLETLANATTGRYVKVSLPERTGRAGELERACEYGDDRQWSVPKGTLHSRPHLQLYLTPVAASILRTTLQSFW